MKTKLLLLLILISGLTFAQVPTDQLMRYDFTGGNIANQVNLGTGDLTQYGATSFFIADRNASAGDALKVRSDSFWGGTTSSTNHSSVTLAFWLKLDYATTAVRPIIHVRGGGSNNGIEFGSTGNSSLYLELDTQAGAQNVTVSIPSLFDDQWHFFVIKTGVEGHPTASRQVIKARLFIDDVENTAFAAIGDSPTSSSAPAFMNSGRLIISPTNKFRFGIDDISYFERAITSTEMTALMAWTPPAPVQLLTRAYVDKDATGANDGTSWTDAFTDINEGLQHVDTNGEVWIAEGTYIPHASDVLATFSVTRNNIAVYGGFAGTETTLNDRDLTANHFTILSGDLNNNDIGVDFGINSRNDNSQHIMEVQSNGVVFDGLHFEDGNANSGTIYSFGGAVYIYGSVNDINFKNCEFNNNLGKFGGAIYGKYTTNATLTIENCIFNHNYSRFGSGVYMLVDAAYTINVNVINTLFINNYSVDNNTNNNKGFTGSAMWLRANATSSNVTTTITNCTFAENHDLGTQSSSEHGALALSRRNDGTSTHNATINNTIFYGNKRNGTTTLAINSAHQIYPNTVSVNNSIDEDNFSNISIGNQADTSNANPSFRNVTNNDFRLQSSSPAINAETTA